MECLALQVVECAAMVRLIAHFFTFVGATIKTVSIKTTSAVLYAV